MGRNDRFGATCLGRGAGGGVTCFAAFFLQERRVVIASGAFTWLRLACGGVG